MTTPITGHRVVSREQWLQERKALLGREKELTRLRDELAVERRELPWVKVEKEYVFQTAGGPRTLGELFSGRSQLVVYHFMFGPEWAEGCPSCSFVADHLEGSPAHLGARDVTLCMVSRAPLGKIEPFKQRMGWRLPWVSSQGSDFNSDFRVSFPRDERAGADGVDYNYKIQPFPSEEAPGMSVFCRNASGEIFHTYSTYGRGLEVLLGTYVMLDMVPKGRDEDALAFGMQWLRYHDRYETNVFADADKPYWPTTAPKLQSASACGCGAGGAKAEAAAIAGGRS